MLKRDYPSSDGDVKLGLKVTSYDISLNVHDSGCDFDLEQKMNGHGLGLTSMIERMKLVDGMFSIESKPGKGTTIHAHAPLTTSGLETTDRVRAAKA